MSHAARPSDSFALSRVVSHPLWLGALALLIANDHFLKGAGILPGVVTGKLSDVSGMLVAPVVLAALLRVRSRSGLALAHLAVALGFTAMELVDAVPVITDQALRLIGLHWVATRDLSDLLVLLLLPACHVWASAVAARRSLAPVSVSPVPTPQTGIVTSALVAVGMVAGIASTDSTPSLSCQGDCDQDGVPTEQDCNDYDANVNSDANNCPGDPGNEDCEDGSDNDSDGDTDCADTDCLLACADSVSACGLATTIDPALGEVVLGSTLGGSWALEGECGGADAPEVIYSVLSRDGVLRVHLPDGHLVHARRECDDPFTALECSIEESVDLDLKSGPITLIVEALDALEASDFELFITFIPTGCGDGALAETEECDDANNVADDGCAANCKIEVAEPPGG